MKNFFWQELLNLANNFDKPLYIVGGFVRDWLLFGYEGKDIDLAGDIQQQEFIIALEKEGIKTFATYKNTGTVMFRLGEYNFEFTGFRKDFYRGGEHKPLKVEKTSDILEDAKRRDFKCNAIYLDVKTKKIVDPLGGVNDIKGKILSTTIEPDKVLSYDGLRLLRLCRFCAKLSLTPTKQTLESARKNANNVKLISAERIKDELDKMLVLDSEPNAPKTAHYNAIKLLDEIGVLEKILPELTLGKNLSQRKDYHIFDVFEHSLKSMEYAPKHLRLVALLHDIGKPFQMKKIRKFTNHAEVGAEIAKDILSRLKYSKEQIKKSMFLIKNHMLCVKKEEKEENLRLIFAKNSQQINDLIELKIADVKASKNSEDFAVPIRLKALFENMKMDNTPFSVRDLKITSKELIGLKIKGKNIKTIQNYLLDFAIKNPNYNREEFLLKEAKKQVEIIQKHQKI